MKALLLWLALLASVAPAQVQCPPGSPSCPYPTPRQAAPQPGYKFRAESPNPAPWQTAVRISWRSGKSSMTVGSGTIIESDPAGLSLVMTAAHVVRGAPASGVTVEVFGASRAVIRIGRPIASYPGTVVDADAQLDVGLVRFQAERTLLSSSLPRPGETLTAGTILCSVGCSHGADPTARSERTTGRPINLSGLPTSKFAETLLAAGYRGIECDRMPEQGRSGGGLFTATGHLVGVCDFADGESKSGLYAETESLRSILRRNGLVELADGRKPVPAVPSPKPSTPDPFGNQIIPTDPHLLDILRNRERDGVLLSHLGAGLGGTTLMGLLWAFFSKLKRSPLPSPVQEPPGPALLFRRIPTPAELIPMFEASLKFEAEQKRIKTEEDARDQGRAEILEKFRALFEPQPPSKN